MYSYEKLENKLRAKDINKTDLTRLLGISSRTIAKIGKGQKLSRAVLTKIATLLQCDPEELYQIISDNPILHRLREEKEANISGGLYHELQVRMAYNSNHIEGSKLTERQTRMIFETNTIGSEGGLLVNDILETVHHFRAVDYVIDHADEALAETFIKDIHYILKHDTTDSTLSWFAVGDYKMRENMVGGRETTKPEEVPAKMQELLSDYNSNNNISIYDIIAFHAKFERIHPFQDGNGRVGRLIALKECLHWNIIPFLIEDRKKAFYYRGLSEWQNEKGFLTDTCLDGQDTFKSLLEMLNIDPVA